MIIQFVKLGGSLRRCLAVWSDYCMKLWSVLSHWISSLMLIVKVGNCWWYQSLSWLNTFNGFTGDQLNKADWNNNGGIFQISPQFKHLHSEKNRVVLNRSQHPQGLIWVKYIGWYFVWQSGNTISLQCNGEVIVVMVELDSGQETGGLQYARNVNVLRGNGWVWHSRPGESCSAEYYRHLSHL